MACILTCKRCGGYNSPSEWPEEERANFNPDLCFNCSRNAAIESADEKEEEPDEIDDDPDGLRAVDELTKEADDVLD